MNEEPEKTESTPSADGGFFDEKLVEKLEMAFHKPTTQFFLHDIAKIASEHDPIDLAHVASHLSSHARVVLYENLPDFHAKIIFLINTGRNTRSIIFRYIDVKEISALLASMPADEAVYLLDDMSDRKMKGALKLLDLKKQQRILDLLKHDRHSAGRLMTNEFFVFDANKKIGQVCTAIRDNPGIELTHRIFVVDENKQLIGYVPERNLIVNPPNWPLKQVMRPVLHSVTVSASRDSVVDIVERYKIPTLPVVDEHHHLVGVITYEDVVEAMEDIADETIASIAGTGEDVSEHESTFRRFLLRAPWLLVTLCAGLTTAGIMTRFQGFPWWFDFVPVFVPLITGMSGNVGIQCSTILVRGMSTGELSSGSKKDAIFKELSVGFLIGSFFGVICGVAVFAADHVGLQPVGVAPYILGTIVGCGVFGACMTAALLGTISPFVFARLGIDPAVSAGPIVTACNDVFSTLMFFLIVRIESRFFLLWQ